MAVKHVKEYVDQVSNQYQEMLSELKDFEKLAEENMFSPERLDQIKETIKPLKDNYERWSYMMYLLNLPNRKSRQPKYHKQNKKLLKNFNENNSVEATVLENSNTLNNLRSIKNEQDRTYSKSCRKDRTYKGTVRKRS